MGCTTDCSLSGETMFSGREQPLVEERWLFVGDRHARETQARVRSRRPVQPHASRRHCRLSIAACARQVSLTRMLKIDAQSSSTSRHRFSASFPSSSNPGATDALYPTHTVPPTGRGSSPNISVTVIYSPLHMGCFLQPTTGRNNNPPRSNADADEQKACVAFSLASPMCSRVFPLRRCDWEGAGGDGAGAALFAAAAEGGAGEGSLDGRMSAEAVPREERLRYRWGEIKDG